jgi:Response regulator containing CheY-like receiver, AAA-type ATPase, and DNA-binding domains
MTNILLVEDNKNHCLLYEEELGFEVYDVVAANDWNKALGKMMEQIPDLIIEGSCIPETDRIYELVRIEVEQAKTIGESEQKYLNNRYQGVR